MFFRYRLIMFSLIFGTVFLGCHPESNMEQSVPKNLNEVCTGNNTVIPKIFCAVLYNDSNALTVVCDHDADINQQLASSISLNIRSDIVSSEIKKPEQVELMQGQTALHVSAWLGNTACTKILLSHNAQMDLFDIKGLAPIHYAIRSDSKVTVQLLVTNGCDINQRTELDRTLKYSSGTTRSKSAEYDEYNFEKNIGHTPLQIASSLGHVEMTLFLIEQGADINARNCAGMTAIHAAAVSGSCKVAEVLISKGADINAQSKSGVTVLHIAAEKEWIGFQSGKLAIIKMLLEKGARTDLRDKYGKTAVDWAKESRNQDALKLLENK